jgi:hypothetical protein
VVPDQRLNRVNVCRTGSGQRFEPDVIRALALEPCGKLNLPLSNDHAIRLVASKVIELA